MNDVVADVVQQERSNNKCYALAFSNIQIDDWILKTYKIARHQTT